MDRTNLAKKKRRKSLNFSESLYRWKVWTRTLYKLKTSSRLFETLKILCSPHCLYMFGFMFAYKYMKMWKTISYKSFSRNFLWCSDVSYMERMSVTMMMENTCSWICMISSHLSYSIYVRHGNMLLCIIILWSLYKRESEYIHQRNVCSYFCKKGCDNKRFHIVICVKHWILDYLNHNNMEMLKIFYVNLCFVHHVHSFPIKFHFQFRISNFQHKATIILLAKK